MVRGRGRLRRHAFAADLGGLAADLHAAMATPSETFPGPVRTATSPYGTHQTNMDIRHGPVNPWLARAEEAVNTALALTGGDDGDWLSAHAGALRAELAPLASSGATPLIRIHGDLHVGQILRWRDGYAVIDFDGNPTVADAEPFQPAARDLAQLATSLEHAARSPSGAATPTPAWSPDGPPAPARRPGPPIRPPGRTRPRRPARQLPAPAVRDRAGVPRADLRRRSPPPLALRAHGRPAWYPMTAPIPDVAPMTDGRRHVNPELYLADLEAKPEALAALASALETGDPFDGIPAGIRRVVFLGMGSSRYAARVAALRPAARRAWTPWPSTPRPAASYPAPGHPRRRDLRHRRQRETLDAVARHRGRSFVLALTNRPGSAVTEGADLVVPMVAGEERGGVACRTFQHTLACCSPWRRLTGAGRRTCPPFGRAAEATADLLDRRGEWLEAAMSLLDGRTASTRSPPPNACPRPSSPP